MITIPECTEETLRKLMVALRKAALGRPISFVFEEGMHRIEDQGKRFSMPNDTVTFRLFVNGGAKDTGVPLDETNPAETPHPSLEASVQP